MSLMIILSCLATMGISSSMTDSVTMGGGEEAIDSRQNKPMIRLQGIRKSYGRNEVLKGLDLEVMRGGAVGLVGKNGSGKSTLLSIMAGALTADAGAIEYGGRNMEQRADLAHMAAFVPQENPLIEELSVKDNLRLWYAGAPMSLRAGLKEGLPYEMGLHEILKEKVRNLSGGMKKRLSIACALANNAPILLLDEPGASLDLVMKQDILSYLRSYLNRGGTIVISSHDRDELGICDQLYHVSGGKLETLPGNLNLQELTRLLNTTSH